MASGSPPAVAHSNRRKPKFLRRKSAGDVVFDVFNLILLSAFCITVLYPFWTTFLLSFSGNDDATTLGFHLWLNEWSLGAYQFALSKYGNVPIAYFNSVFRAFFGTLLTIVVTILAAYPLSKRNLPGRNLLTLVVLITMFFNGGLIPTYLLIRNIGLYDTRWALILPVAAVGFYIIIMRNFMMTIDTAFEEAAFIDGANYAQVLVRVIVPLSKPVIATIALWTAVQHWNEWFNALIYIRDESKDVLQTLLRRMIQETTTIEERLEYAEDEGIELPSEALKAAVTILTIGPIILLYPFIQKHFVKGIFMGSLKG